MASTSSFLTVALIVSTVVLLGAANTCHAARRLAEPLPAPHVPGTPNKPMPRNLVDLLEVLEKLPVPDSEKLLPPVLTDLVQEVKLLVPVLKVPNSKVLRPENKLVPVLTDLLHEVKLLTPILKGPNSKVLGLENQLMPILTDLLQDIKMLRATLKVLRLESMLMPPILTGLALFQEMKLPIPTLKVPNSKMVRPENKPKTNLADLLQDLVKLPLDFIGFFIQQLNQRKFQDIMC